MVTGNNNTKVGQLHDIQIVADVEVTIENYFHVATEGK